MEEQQSFDEFFRESLADYRETPPPAAWDMVAQRLDDDDRKRRRGFFYWPWTVLSMILLIGAAWWLYGWFKPGDSAVTGASHSSAGLPQAQATPLPVATGAGDRPHAPVNEPAAGSSHGDHSDIQAADREAYGSAMQSDSQANDRQRPATTRNHGGPVHASPAVSAAQPTTAARPVARTIAAVGSRGGGNYDAAVHAQRVPITATAQQPQASPNLPRQTRAISPAQVAPAGNAALSTGTSRQKEAPAAALPVSAATGNSTQGGAPQTGMQDGQQASAITTPQQTPASGDAAPPWTAASGTMQSAPDPIPDGARSGGTDNIVAVPGKNPDAGSQPPAPMPSMPRPQVLIAALEPVMHLFSGSVLPPVLNIYESGLLDPNNYYPPIAPAPVIVAAGTASGNASAAPMLPADSSIREVRSAFSLGSFFGYERGIKVPPRNMFSLGLSMLWQLNDRISVGMQPALLHGSVPRTNLTTDQAYQRSATDVIRFKTRDYSPSILGQIDTVNNYVIREAYDSIRVRGTYLRGNMWQLELPLILQFNPFGRAFRMYGGPSIHIGGSMRIRSEGPTEIYHFDRRDSIVQSEQMSEEQIKNYFGRSNLPSYNSYNPDMHSFQSLDPVRFGYQFGVGYERNRLNFDLSVRQQLTGYHQLSSELRQIYSGPVFRLSLGYKLIPQRVRPTNPKP